MVLNYFIQVIEDTLTKMMCYVPTAGFEKLKLCLKQAC